MKEIQELFNKEMTRQCKELGGLEVGSEDYKEMEECLTKLADRAIAMEKAQNEADKKAAERKDEQKDRIVQYCIRGLEIAVPTALAIWGTSTTLKYDKEGVLPTTLMGRGFINKLIPKK